MTKRVLTDPCIEKAMDDEPAFVLLARDPMAPALVRLWAAFRRQEVASGTRGVAELAQIGAAELEAERMEIWRRDAGESWRKQGELELPPHDYFNMFPEHRVSHGYCATHNLSHVKDVPCPKCATNEGTT